MCPNLRKNDLVSRSRQENRVSLVGNRGKPFRCRTGCDKNRAADSRIVHPSSHRLRDAGSFLLPPARDCMSLVHLVRDYMRLNEDGTSPAPICVGAMKGMRYTSARRTQHWDAREQRVQAGAPSARLDWQHPICGGWYSSYHSRNAFHLHHCEKKHTHWIARQERRQAQAPLPSPDHFTPNLTPQTPTV
ncbi:hypothetical protein BDM02DRAFT_2359828 [Thelephora ganbajun]|uniref:Uncharacterized protein n=1 Tax=Thelephora ganbajun TaxID=370292 RepID=A0ACB6ZFL2_THEGA|nr:hypothetical protein BDM02DRAFT_2359828 [Thelephora ganbajun]